MIKFSIYHPDGLYWVIKSAYHAVSLIYNCYFAIIGTAHLGKGGLH